MAGTVYNIDNSVIRLALMLCWAFLPISLLMLKHNEPIPAKHLKDLVFALTILILLNICFLFNINTFVIELSGPSVEKFTPFLYLFHVTALLFFYQLGAKRISGKFITYFMLLLVTILAFDMVMRYLQGPEFFLNYSTRKQAKTLGLFATTNVNGQIIVFILAISWCIKYQFKKLIEIALIVILITTMARSAIVSLILIYCLKYTFFHKSILSRIFTVLLIIIVGLTALFDPLNFQRDGSLLSKIDFFRATYDLIVNGTAKDIVFGYGASMEAITGALDVQGWSPHISILKAFLYYGVIGVIIFALTIIYFLKAHKGMLLPVTAFLIFSLAGAPIFWPTMSVGLVLLKIYDNIEKSRREKLLLREGNHVY